MKDKKNSKAWSLFYILGLDVVPLYLGLSLSNKSSFFGTFNQQNFTNFRGQKDDRAL